MDKHRILIITSSYPRWKGDYGGHFIRKLSIRLKKTFQVNILAPASQKTSRFENEEGLKIYRFSQFPIKGIELADGMAIIPKLKKNRLYLLVLPYFLLSQFIALVKIVKKERISTIHAHWIIPQAFTAVIYKKLFNKEIKLLVTIHGSDINHFKGYFERRLTKWVLNSICNLTVVSNALKNDVVGLGYKRYIYVYPMGVDTQLFRPDKRDNSIRNNLRINGAFILFVGSLIESKGIRTLVKAMPAIIQTYPDAKLLVVGEGLLKSELILLTRKLNISNSIIFKGAVINEELPNYYATADLFVLPSSSEGFALVVMEALSSGTLTVTSTLDAFRDTIIEYETGFYIYKINSEQISSKIIHILKNKMNYKRISEKGRKHVVDNFDWDIVEKNYRNLIRNLN